MKRRRCCFVFIGWLATAEGFGNRFAASPFKQHQHDRVSRGSGISMLAAEGAAEGDGRIEADPDALEEWVSRMGGAIGPVVLDGGWWLEIRACDRQGNHGCYTGFSSRCHAI